MTVHAPAHLELLGGEPCARGAVARVGNQIDPVHRLDRTVTILTRQADTDVRLMAELNVLGKLVHANPGTAGTLAC
jgi:hypothetical protein